MVHLSSLVYWEELRQQQRADPAIYEIFHLTETWETLLDLPIYLREINKIELKDDIFYSKRQIGSEAHHQIVLPKMFREMVMIILHGNMGHLVFDQTLDLT